MIEHNSSEFEREREGFVDVGGLSLKWRESERKILQQEKSMRGERVEWARTRVLGGVGGF